LAQQETGHTPSRRHPEWWGGDIPWIALPDIRRLDGHFATETEEHTNLDGIAHSAARVLPKGTVCLSRTASVGFVTVMGREMATSQDFVDWVPGESLDSAFLMYLLMASRRYIRSLASGATHQTVYMPTLRSFRVCVPHVAEQRRISASLMQELEGIEKAEQALGEESKAVEALPASLLRRAFSGEL